MYSVSRNLLFLVFITVVTNKDVCEDIECPNNYEPVCGMTLTDAGLMVVNKYVNLCHLEKVACRLRALNVNDVQEISGVYCNLLPKPRKTRRVHDFSIVGAHQSCNHSCPTYCIDTYEPVCAQIWNRGMKGSKFRPMVNHCHVDLYSCAAGVNVTTQPLGRCYKNPNVLLFMTQVAALKSLGLLSDDDPALRPIINHHQT